MTTFQRQLTQLLTQEILAMTPKSRPKTYQFAEGKIKVGYNKILKNYWYSLDGHLVEEQLTAEDILASLLGYITNQDKN